MDKEENVMTAAELFDFEEKGCPPVAKPRKRGKKNNRKATFADIKTRMVMRVYGVSRAEAEKIIAERMRKETASSNEKSTATDGSAGIFLDESSFTRGRGLVNAEEFFGRR